MKSAITTLLALLAGMSAAHADGGDRGICQEDFTSVAQLPSRGWIYKNNSNPPGSTGWFQGNPAVFAAHSGASNSYLSADKNNAGTGFPVVSNWAITPVIRFQPGLQLTFFTRSAGGPGSAADRLQVLYCQRGPGVSCKDPGPDSGSMMNYSELLMVNPNSQAGGYPTSWTAYSVTSAQGLPTSGSGRIAFRYYNLWQNPNDWGTTIGIDILSVTGISGCPLHDTIFYNGLQG